MVKKLTLYLLLLISVLGITACGEEATVFSYCELVIPLSEEYKEIKEENFDAAFTNGKYIIAVTRISFVAGLREGIPETMTASEFGEFWLDKCSRSANIISENITYAEYYDEAADKFYIEAFYRSPYAYFVVLFASSVSAEDAGRAEFLQYAEGIYFTD